MRQNRLTEQMTRKVNRQTPGHGWHSGSYHRYFEGYAEFETLDAKGRTKIERIYEGTWYVQSLEKRARITSKLLLTALWLLAAVAYFLVASRNCAGNRTWYVTIGQFAFIFCMGYTLTGWFNFMTAPVRMTVGDFNTGMKRFEKGCLASIGACILTALLYVVASLILESNIVVHLLCAAGCLAPAALLLLANRLTTHYPIQEEQSTERAPEGAARID